jgi:hypothetical protein
LKEDDSMNNATLPATVARWGARILSGMILLFWGFFLIAHLIGDEGSPSRPLNWSDYTIVSALLLSLVGLALAWKWELAGAALTLAAVLVCAAVNWKIVAFPGTLIPVTAVLFVASWWLRRGPRGVPAAGRQTG